MLYNYDSSPDFRRHSLLPVYILRRLMQWSNNEAAPRHLSNRTNALSALVSPPRRSRQAIPRPALARKRIKGVQQSSEVPSKQLHKPLANQAYQPCSLASSLSPSLPSLFLRPPHPPPSRATTRRRRRPRAATAPSPCVSPPRRSPQRTDMLHVRHQASSAAGAAILKAIGVDLSDLNVLLGLTCSPISVVGVGSGSACSGSTVSCTDGVVVRVPPRSLCCAWWLTCGWYRSTASASAACPCPSKGPLFCRRRT